MSQEPGAASGGCGCLLLLIGIVLCFTWTRKAVSEIEYDLVMQHWSSEVAYQPPPQQEESVDVVQPVYSEPVYTAPEYSVTESDYSIHSRSSTESKGFVSLLKDTGNFVIENPEIIISIINWAIEAYGDFKPEGYYKRGGGGYWQPYDPNTGQYR